MSANDIGSLAYLGLLGAALLGYALVASRGRPGQFLRQAALWGLIFAGAIAVAGLWPDIRDNVAPRQSYVGAGSVEVPRGFDGHYRITLGLNGTPIDFVIDTGATDIVLSQRDARRIGIDPDGLAWLGRATTANGTVPLAQVVLDTVTLGEMTDTNVRASVNGGEMDGSLLGMSYLSRFGRIEIAGGKLLLER